MAGPNIVIRQRDIEWVLSRLKTRRDIILTGFRIGIIVTAIIGEPSRILRAAIIRHRIISRRTLADLLKDKGLSVFLSYFTLEQLGTSDYTRAIDSALE
jgi:hypothetical protein